MFDEAEIRPPHEMIRFFESVASVVPVQPTTLTNRDEDEAAGSDDDEVAAANDAGAAAAAPMPEHLQADPNEAQAVPTRREQRVAARSAKQPKAKKRARMMQEESADSGLTKVILLTLLNSHVSAKSNLG